MEEDWGEARHPPPAHPVGLVRADRAAARRGRDLVAHPGAGGRRTGRSNPRRPRSPRWRTKRRRNWRPANSIDRIEAAIAELFSAPRSVETLARLRPPSRAGRAADARTTTTDKPGPRESAAPDETPPAAHPRQPRELLDGSPSSLADRQTRNLIIEILDSGEPTHRLGNARLPPADEVGRLRPRAARRQSRWISAFTSSRTIFTATSSRTPTRWTCFRLTALDSEETLFGYVASGRAPRPRTCSPSCSRTAAAKSAVILRLDHSRRTPIPPRSGHRKTDVSPRWLYLDPPGYPALDIRRDPASLTAIESDFRHQAPAPAAGFLPVLPGSSRSWPIQYGIALWQLTHSSGGMMNKFSALARDKYLGFLVRENLQMLVAYVVLALAAAILAQPFVAVWTAASKYPEPVRHRRSAASASPPSSTDFSRCVSSKTRPYFLNEAEFGHWYYKALDLIPDAVETRGLLHPLHPAPHRRRRLRSRSGTSTAAAASAGPSPPCLVCGIGLTAGISHFTAKLRRVSSRCHRQAAERHHHRLRLPARRPPRLRRLPARSAPTAPPPPASHPPSTRSPPAPSAFERCYTSIASTMESGVQLMSSQYPQSHGIRQMYPDRETVEATKKRIVTLATLLRERGYDTAAIGDWCAGYYEVIPLGFEHISVSSFDNFKIYMSQAVVMAHFVVPLYFDNPARLPDFPPARVLRPVRHPRGRHRAASSNASPKSPPSRSPSSGTSSIPATTFPTAARNPIAACSRIPPIRDLTATAWTSTSTPSSAAPTSNPSGRPCRPRKSHRSARSTTAAPASSTIASEKSSPPSKATASRKTPSSSSPPTMATTTTNPASPSATASPSTAASRPTTCP